MRVLANVFEIKAREKCNRRHMVDIPRMTFFAQHRYRANWSFLDEHKLRHQSRFFVILHSTGVKWRGNTFEHILLG